MKSNYKSIGEYIQPVDERNTKKSYCIEFLTRRFISTEYNQIEVSNYPKIAYLVEYQSGVYYFQKLSSSQVVKKKFFEISNEPTIIDKRIIIIDNYADAIYEKDADTLYFKKLTSITSIFNGLEQVYREFSNIRKLYPHYFAYCRRINRTRHHASHHASRAFIENNDR